MTVLWDWNGTLIADVPHVVRINNLVFRAHGYRDTTAEEYRSLFRFPVRDYYLEYGVTEEDFLVIAREWNELYVEGFEEVPLAPHVPETVRRFQAAGFRQVILSASQVDQLRAQVVRFSELDGIFDEVLGIGDVYASSKVQLARDYLAHGGIDPEDTVFIGDTSHDAEVARAIGVKCLLVSGGHQNDDVLKKTGATVLRSLTDAYDILGA